MPVLERQTKQKEPEDGKEGESEEEKGLVACHILLDSDAFLGWLASVHDSSPFYPVKHS